MATSKLAATLLLIVALGAVGFLAGQLLLGGDGGTEAQQPGIIDRLDALKTGEAEQKAEPRFVGELLGIYIAPSLNEVPAGVRAADERLTAGGCEAVPVDRAGALNFARPLVMPGVMFFLLLTREAIPARSVVAARSEALGGATRRPVSKEYRPQFPSSGSLLDMTLRTWPRPRCPRRSSANGRRS